MSAYKFVKQLGLDKDDPAVAKRLREIEQNRDATWDRDTTGEALHSLHKDEDIETRLNIASHPNVLNHTLEGLVDDPSKQVRHHAKQTLKARKEAPQTIKKILDDPYGLYVALNAARNEFQAPEVLDVTAKHRSTEVRVQTAVHDNTSDKAMIELAKDPNPEISERAKMALTERGISFKK